VKGGSYKKGGGEIVKGVGRDTHWKKRSVKAGKWRISLPSGDSPSTASVFDVNRTLCKEKVVPKSVPLERGGGSRFLGEKIQRTHQPAAWP